MAIELTTANTQTLSAIQAYTGIFPVFNMFPKARFSLEGTTVNVINNSSLGDTVDFTHPLCSRFRRFSPGQGGSLSVIIGGQNLVDLEDAGTSVALGFLNMQFSAATLNAFFTALPATTKTATIVVTGNPGAGTCDTTIATNKGYTVTT